MNQPATISAQDWSGPPHQRPGLMRPRPYQAERLAEKERKANPDREPDAPDQVLVRRAITELAELVALSNGAKLVLGVTKNVPAGQLGPGWTWWARQGFGWRGRDGRITESLYLRVDRSPRATLFLWSRPVPDPRVIVATLRDYAEFEIPGTFVLSVLAQLPVPEWTSEYVTAWTATATGQPEDIPRSASGAAVKKEIRS